MTDGRDVTVEAVLACHDCAQAATTCAAACLGEEPVDELTGCAQALLDAADVAAATAQVLSRTGAGTCVARAMLTACWLATRHAREQCQEHLPLRRHRSVCVRTCRRAEQACCDLLGLTP